MKPKKMPSPIRVKAVAKPIMMTTTISASIRSPRAGSLMQSRSCLDVSAHAALASGLLDLGCLGDGELARFLVDVLAMGQLFPDHVDLGHVLEPRRPGAGSQADDAAHHLGDALQQHQRAGDRDHRL